MLRCRHRRSHRAAATALPPSRCAPPSQRRRQAKANVALSRCRHHLAAAKLPLTSAFALPPPPQLPRCRHRRAAAAAAPPFDGWLLRCCPPSDFVIPAVSRGVCFMGWGVFVSEDNQSNGKRHFNLPDVCRCCG
jgi:hypothetical protein